MSDHKPCAFCVLIWLTPISLCILFLYILLKGGT